MTQHKLTNTIYNILKQHHRLDQYKQFQDAETMHLYTLAELENVVLLNIDDMLNRIETIVKEYRSINQRD
jgi:hypothetical protein